jgi:histidine triad (HIT) family protein
MTVDDCVFCAIIRGDQPADMVASLPEAIAIRPLNPVVPGHVLVLPTTHVRDAGDNPVITAATMRMAAGLVHFTMPEAYNIITSAGEAATQSVFHLHIHLVPRLPGDGLSLPWTEGSIA